MRGASAREADGPVAETAEAGRAANGAVSEKANAGVVADGAVTETPGKPAASAETMAAAVETPPAP